MKKYDKLIYKYRKNRKSNKCNKIQALEREEIKEGPEMSVITERQQGFCLLAKNPRHNYRKNRKINKSYSRFRKRRS